MNQNSESESIIGGGEMMECVFGDIDRRTRECFLIPSKTALLIH